jgi:hypothetical protein
VATGTLSDVPWFEYTTVSYWSEVELEAPRHKGYYKWQAKFPKTRLRASAHKGASCTFGFGTRNAGRSYGNSRRYTTIYNNTRIKNAEVVLQSFETVTQYRVCSTTKWIGKVSRAQR